MPSVRDSPLFVLLSRDCSLQSTLELVSGVSWICVADLEPLRANPAPPSVIIVDGRQLATAELRQRVRTISALLPKASLVALAPNVSDADALCDCGALDVLGGAETTERSLRRMWAYVQQVRNQRKGIGRKKNEQASELVFRLLHNLPLTVWFVDKSEQILLVEGENVTGDTVHSAKDFVSTKLSDWEGAYPDEVRLARAALKGEEGRLVVQRGDTAHNVRLTPYRNGDGEVIGATGFSSDVTALVDAQTRIRRFFELDMVGVTFWKNTGQFSYMNDAFLRMLGYTTADLEAGRVNWKEMTPEEFRDADERALAQLEERGTCESYEKELICADTGRLPLLVCSGKLEGCSDDGVSLFVDLRPVRQATDQLEASRRLFNAAAECSLDGLLLLEAQRGSPPDDSYSVVDLNACAARMLNRGREDVKGRLLSELLPVDLVGQFNDLTGQSRSGEMVQRSFPFNVAGSDVQWINAQAAPLGDGAVIHIRDMTQQKQQEQELIHSRDLLRTILKSLATHIWLLDSEGRVTDVNDSWLASSYDSGFRRRRTLGRHVGEVLEDLITEASLRPAAVKAIHNVIKKRGGQYVLEYRRERRDRTLYYLMSVTPMRDDYEGAVVATHDITDLKEAQRALAAKSLQQEIVAELGQAGLSGKPPEDLIKDAVSGLARGAGADGAIGYRWEEADSLFHPILLLGAEHGPAESQTLQAELLDLRKELLAATGAAVKVCDEKANTSFANWKRNQGFKCALFSLARSGDDRSVMLCAFSRRVSGFSSSDIFFANSISHVLGSAMARLATQHALQRRVGQLAALRTMDLAITASLDLTVTLDVLLLQIIAQMNADGAAVLLYEPRSDKLVYATGRGEITSALENAVVDLGQTYAGSAAEMQTLLYVENLGAQPDHPLYLHLQAYNMEYTTYYAIPLVAKGRLEGVLEIFHKRRVQVDDEQVALLEAMAAQAAIAVHNAELFNRLEAANMNLVCAYDQTLEGWARALDYRDRETEGHSRRVTEGTVQLARVMALPETDIIHIRRGALLHDIGKMAIPDAVLQKPGPLNDAEWEIMRRHPVYAREMLLDIEFLGPALEIPWCHHEHWNGEGYPRRMKGEEIPLAARIFAVIDVWDALRSDRPYRKAWGRGETLDYILGQSGKQFDPSVIEAFKQMVANETAG